MRTVEQFQAVLNRLSYRGFAFEAIEPRRAIVKAPWGSSAPFYFPPDGDLAELVARIKWTVIGLVTEDMVENLCWRERQAIRDFFGNIYSRRENDVPITEYLKRGFDGQTNEPL